MVEEKKYRVESDLLGELKVPAEALYAWYQQLPHLAQDYGRQP